MILRLICLHLSIHISSEILLKFFDLFCCCFFAIIGTVFNNANQHINVYGDDIEVDYRGYEVNHKQAETFN